MKKLILFSFAVLIAVSCIPIQAVPTQTVKDRSTWIVVKNGAKILVGGLLIWSGISGIYGAVQYGGAVKGLRMAALAEGTSLTAFEAEMHDRNVYQVIGLNLYWGASKTAGGIALIYSGYKGLAEVEAEVKP